jgi:hypothetical protein
VADDAKSNKKAHAPMEERILGSERPEHHWDVRRW